MDQASQLFARADRCRADAIALPKVVIHFAVEPRRAMTWRAHGDAEIRSHDAMVWLTRSPGSEDYWMRPGDVLRLKRGERIWLSTDGDVPAEMSITTAYAQRGAWLRHALAASRRWLHDQRERLERLTLRRRE